MQRHELNTWAQWEWYEWQDWTQKVQSLSCQLQYYQQFYTEWYTCYQDWQKYQDFRKKKGLIPLHCGQRLQKRMDELRHSMQKAFPVEKERIFYGLDPFWYLSESEDPYGWNIYPYWEWVYGMWSTVCWLRQQAEFIQSWIGWYESTIYLHFWELSCTL